MNRFISTKERNSTGLDWMLLMFLVGASYSKIYVKVFVVVIYILYCLYKKYEFKSPNGINKFYFIIIIAGTISSIIQNSFFNDVYVVTFGFSVFTWLVAGSISYLLYTSVVNISWGSLHKTLKGFFALNVVASFANIVQMIIKSGHLIPYWYWDATEYFGSSTGDHVYGIFGNLSITNATISVLGTLYFLYVKELRWALLCLLITLLCTSNATLLVSLVMLFALLFLAKESKVRKYTFIALLMIGIVYPLLTVENLGYIGYVYEEGTKETDTKEYVLPLKEPFKITDEVTKELTKLGNYVQGNYYRYKLSSYITFTDDLKYINSSDELKAGPGKVNLMEPDILKEKLKKWYGFGTDVAPVSTFHKPLKLYSHIQTLFFLGESKKNFLFGAGISNFSSKIAVKATGLDIQGSYPTKYTYVNKNFAQYHLYTLFYLFSLPISEHSAINFPNSVYNNIAGEYGLIGIVLFIVLYLGMFYKNRKLLTFGKFILPLALMFFELEYWFEMISLTVILELIIFIDIYKVKHNV